MQQAVEKLLKAVLTKIDVHHRPPHDVAELVAMVESHDEPLPTTPITVSRLTAFAVEFRYDDLPGSLALDPAARKTVAILRQHVEARLDQISAARRQPPE